MSEPILSGGILVQADHAVCFVPATIAVEIVARPRITPVPGAPPELLGIALYAGIIVPVLAIGTSNAEMIVCQHGGELIGLFGGRVLRTGSFDVKADGHVEFDGLSVPPLDVAAVRGRIEAGALAARRTG